jgi:hypothetical protein
VEFLTYIPMSRGFVYLAVVLDWFSRPRHVVATAQHRSLAGAVQAR